MALRPLSRCKDVMLTVFFLMAEQIRGHVRPGDISRFFDWARVSSGAALGLSLTLILLNGCTPVKRSVEPSVQIQQLQVLSDDKWAINVRLQNFSATTQTTTDVHLNLMLNDRLAATIKSAEVVAIPAESVDVLSINVQPTPSGRLWIADALASNHSLTYTLRGTIVAHFSEKKRSNTYTLTQTHRLDPVPGLTGLLR